MDYLKNDLTPLAFAQELVARGIEIILRGTRLHVWPSKAYQSLSEEERAYIRAHRQELKELATAKVLPEATVVWSPDGPATPTAATHTPTTPSPTPPRPRQAAPACPYCGGPCVGKNHDAFRTLHWNDPAEIRRRSADASAEMGAMMRPEY